MPTGKEGLIAGIIEFKINGDVQQAKGNFVCNPGKPKLDEIMGSDNTLQGFKGTAQAAKIEGEITDSLELDVEALFTLRNATVTVSLANGKIFVLSDAAFTGDGDVNTEEANIPVMFKGKSGEFVR